MFDEQYYDIRLERSVTVDPSRNLTVVPLTVVPAIKGNTNALFDISPDCKAHSELFEIITVQQRSNGAGVILVKVRNKTLNKVRLPRGMIFGLVKPVLSDPSSVDEETIGSRSAMVDIERISIPPSSDDSESSTDSVVELSEDESAESVRTESEKKVVITDDATDSVIGTVDMDLELLATADTEFLANVDILKELSEQLTPEPTMDITLNNWEELNPTFSNFSIDSSLDVNEISNLDTNMGEDISPNLSLFEGLADKDVIEDQVEYSEVSNQLALQPDQVAPQEPIESEWKPEDSVDLTGLAPLTISSRVARTREPFPLDEAKPLVRQLQLIKDKIKNNKVEGDLSDQFPSLIGQEEYVPLYKTLIQYTGCKLTDIDYEFLDFGEKVYSEIFNFGIENLEELFVEVEKLHNKNRDAVLKDWVEAFCERFECLQGINDLNGDNFDCMVTQWMVLHFCKKLVTSTTEIGLDPNVRDMVGYPSFDGFDVIEEQISHGRREQIILEQEIPGNQAGKIILEKVENFPSEQIIGNDEINVDFFQVEPKVEGEMVKATETNAQIDTEAIQSIDIQSPPDISGSGTENLVRIESVHTYSAMVNESPELPPENLVGSNSYGGEDKKTAWTAEESADWSKLDDNSRHPLEGQQTKETVPVTRDAVPVAADAVPVATESVPITKESASITKDRTLVTEVAELVTKESASVAKEAASVTKKPASVEKEAASITKETASGSTETVPVTKKNASVTKKTTPLPAVNDNLKHRKENVEAINEPAKPPVFINEPTAVENQPSGDMNEQTEERNVSIGSRKEGQKDPQTVDKKDTETKTAEVETIDVEAVDEVVCTAERRVLPPIDPDEDFCDLYLGVKMEAGPTECSVMIFNEEMTTNAVFSAPNLYTHGKQMSQDADVERLLTKEGEDQDLILVYIPNLNKDGVSQAEVAIPLSSWDDDKSFFSGFVLYFEPKVSRIWIVNC